MNIGYDLDGVLARIDIGNFLKARTKKAVTEYYKLLIPYCTPRFPEMIQANYFIITGRSKEFIAITKKWLIDHKLLGKAKLIMVGDNKYDISERYDVWACRQLLAKADALRKYKIDIYFEDNPYFVKILKRMCPLTKIVLVTGGRKEE